MAKVTSYVYFCLVHVWRLHSFIFQVQRTHTKIHNPVELMMALCTVRCLVNTTTSMLTKLRLSPTWAAQKCKNLSVSPRLLSDRKYRQSHEWISVSDNVGTVGISNYAQEAVGEIVFASIAETGTLLQAGESCGEIESVKAVSDVYVPVSGTVIETNSNILDKPSLINSSPHDQGWLLKLELSNKEELNDLMDETAYQEFLKTFES